jgi:histidinol dehydrogenase
MKIYKYPNWDQATRILQRPQFADSPDLLEKTAQILKAVREDGDDALRLFSAKFDGMVPDTWRIDEREIQQAERQLSVELKSAIDQAYQNITLFHRSQCAEEPIVSTMPGVSCWRKNVPVDRVGVYIPGGSAPLFSTVLMLGVPAQIAGCKQVVLCTPPQKNGEVHPAILYGASLCGIKEIYAIGGAQAIAAMAYGTASVPGVYKIFGPGNRWVTAAKQLVSLEGVAIDMPAGPSEVCIVADAAANPSFIAADLLSQAEHGPDSQVVFITNTPGLIELVDQALKVQVSELPRQAIALQALENSQAILVEDIESAMKWANYYAPEHLILAVEHPESLAGKVQNAGSVFLGNFTPESAGDYASGTNHALPTNGYARGYSGVSVDSFLKKITFQLITPDGLLKLGPIVQTMANAEGLEAHAMAVKVRLTSIQETNGR